MSLMISNIAWWPSAFRLSSLIFLNTRHMAKKYAAEHYTSQKKHKLGWEKRWSGASMPQSHCKPNYYTTVPYILLRRDENPFLTYTTTGTGSSTPRTADNNLWKDGIIMNSQANRNWKTMWAIESSNGPQTCLEWTTSEYGDDNFYSALRHSASNVKQALLWLGGCRRHKVDQAQTRKAWWADTWRRWGFN